MKKNRYKERQSFDDKIVFLSLGAGIMGTLFVLIKSIVIGQFSLQVTVLSIVTALVLTLLVWWLKQLKMKVNVNDKRIKFKMSPIHNKSHKIKWEEVESCEIVKTPKSAQWHGSNIPSRGESSFSLAGRNGLSIAMKDGKRFFIGCKDVDQLQSTLSTLSI